MMDIAYEAMLFAKLAHQNQVRKYTGEPYSNHLAEVAGIVSTIAPSLSVQQMVATAWLHDVLEDTDVTATELNDRFGATITKGVIHLTDNETGNRAERKAMACLRLGSAPGWVQTIKCADLISNTSSILTHDPKFAKVYVEEKMKMLLAMTKADPRLRDHAMLQVERARSQLRTSE